MGAATTRELLNPKTWQIEVQGIAPWLGQGRDAEIVRAVEDAEEPLMMLDGMRVRGETVLGQQHRHQAAARRMAHMQWLGHGAEITFQAARHRGCHGQRDGCLLRLQSPGMGRRRDGAEDAQRRGRVPAFVIMRRMNGPGEAVLDFKPHGIGRNQVSA